VSIKVSATSRGRRAKSREQRRRGLALRDWPVSSRLLAVIVLALIMGLVFGGLRVADAVGSADQFGQVTRLASLGEQVTILVQDIQNERDETAAVVAGASPASLTSLYSATDEAGAQARADAAALGGGVPANIASAVAAVVTDTQNLSSVRNLAKAEGNPVTVITDYADDVADMLALNSQIAQGVSDPTLTNDVRTLDSASQAKEQVAEQRALVANALTERFFGFGVESAINTAVSMEQIDLSAFQATATPAQQSALAAVTASAQASNATSIESFLISDSDPFTDIVNLGISATRAPAQWYSLMSYEINQMQDSELSIAREVVARAESLQGGAQRSALINGVITGAVLLLVLLAALLVARSLVLPLRKLRAGALDVAQVQLPERVRQLSESRDPTTGLEVAPIDVLSADEIGQVARAFDQVHHEAVRLAGEEAVLRASFNAMFTNLSRRSQSLIERLARTIDSLEQNEDDPDRLSDLFSMDHMVTRMRRNSENLLLLAGHEGARKWSEAVPLADVARAAVSEIEQYSRVALNIQPGISVVGAAVSDVVHLLAELIENATLYSSSDTQVHVSAQEVTTGGVLIEVTDKGIGVAESKLAEINWRLDNPQVMDVSVSRHMGLFAVARLAVRHQVRVRLRPANPQGVSALVWLPDGVLERTVRRYADVGSGWSSQAAMHGGTASGQAPRQRGLEARPALEGQYASVGTGDPVVPPVEQQASNWFRRATAATDEGWGAAAGHYRAGRAAAPISGDQTAAGLPSRVPRANLIPGSAGPSDRRHTARQAPRGPAPLPQRSPDLSRERLSGFQRGARRADEHPASAGEGEAAER